MPSAPLTPDTPVRVVDEQFIDLICSDPDWLAAEFHGIVTAGGPTPPGHRSQSHSTGDDSVDSNISHPFGGPRGRVLPTVPARVPGQARQRSPPSVGVVGQLRSQSVDRWPRGHPREDGDASACSTAITRRHEPASPRQAQRAMNGARWEVRSILPGQPRSIRHRGHLFPGTSDRSTGTGGRVPARHTDAVGSAAPRPRPR